MNKRLKRMVDRTLFYYLIIGILNYIVCTGIMFVLFNLCGFSDHIAPLFNYGLGSVIWYLSCRYILFRGKQSSWQRIIRFIIEVIVCYLISYYVIAPLAARALLRIPSIRHFFSFGGSEEEMVRGNCEMAVGALAYAFLNYFGQRYFVFSGRFELRRQVALAAQEELDSLPDEEELSEEEDESGEEE